MAYDKFGNVNSVTVMGRAGKDPDVKYTPGGVCVLNVSVATTKRIKRKNSEEAEEQTQWHRIVAFGKTAELCAERMSKGSQVLAIGSIQYRQYEDKEGVTKYITEIVADRLEVIGGSGEGKKQSSGGGPQFFKPGAPSDEDIPF